MRFNPTALKAAAVATLAAATLGGALAAPASAAPGVPTISVGSKSTHGVWCVQKAVNNWAERTGHGRPLGEDGVFGAGTKAWVVKFQVASGLNNDGKVGPQTGKSILDNAGGYRNYCWTYVPSPN
ncbi:hypothetical protein DWB77_00842 [Streptomyces hundungensis]|uniref:Peptidoglycan binding-like domain-containing protein n=1 Tax=Streptomyces hundungensis TaxID=1077946 RepID=A0A387H5P7_9ACTN|nr:peptidoglycan-binding domain-containing protein [Streptomyces hundungensis]AYG78734.1 hypothetical protein DWB77_00842 [Streptomyces hundungensis]